MVQALGNDPSPQELLLIRQVCIKSVRCKLFEIALAQLNGKSAPSLEASYLQWSRELRHDLVALGLSRRQRDVTSLATIREELSSG